MAYIHEIKEDKPQLRVLIITEKYDRQTEHNDKCNSTHQNKCWSPQIVQIRNLDQPEKKKDKELSEILANLGNLKNGKPDFPIKTRNRYAAINNQENHDITEDRRHRKLFTDYSAHRKTKKQMCNMAETNLGNKKKRKQNKIGVAKLTNLISSIDQKDVGVFNMMKTKKALVSGTCAKTSRKTKGKNEIPVIRKANTELEQNMRESIQAMEECYGGMHNYFRHSAPEFST